MGLSDFFSLLGRSIAESVVTPELVHNAMANEFDRLALLPENAPHADMLRDYASRARATSCEQRQIGIADDHRYQTLLVIKCDTCGEDAMVRPNTKKICFSAAYRTHAKNASVVESAGIPIVRADPAPCDGSTRRMGEG